MTLGRPEHVTPGIPSAKIKIKQTRRSRNSEKKKETKSSLGRGKYPDIDVLRKETLHPPAPSPRYGDFKNPDHRKHYLAGNCYPHPDVLSGNNSLMRRTYKDKSNDSAKIIGQPGSSTSFSSSQSEEVEIEEDDLNYRSKAVEPPDQKDINRFLDSYDKHELPELGTLYRNRRLLKQKWKKTQKARLRKPKYPPIIIPSRGRARTALLDLTEAMNNESYVEIVVVSSDERDEYLQTLCKHNEIDVFVMKECEPGENQTAGRARHFSKKQAKFLSANQQISLGPKHIFHKEYDSETKNCQQKS